MLGASSPCTALPLPATHCWGRAPSCSLGRSTARWQMTHTGSDAAGLCFFPTGQHSSCPQAITHFIDGTATGQHRLISCSGRQSNGPGFGSHSHYARQGNPATSRVWDQACPTKTGSDGQCPGRPMLPQMLSCFMELPGKTTQHCGTKQRKAMAPW